jgi:uncharacterized membrane protein HdeD (DUF308 family)
VEREVERPLFGKQQTPRRRGLNMFGKKQEVKKHSAWSIFGGLISAALAVFLIVHPFKTKAAAAK